MSGNNYCCGWPLRTGSIAIGIISTIGSIILVIDISIEIIRSIYKISYYDDQLSTAVKKAISIASLTLSLLSLMLSLMLLIGSTARHKNLIYPMIAVTFTSILGFVTLFIPTMMFLEEAEVDKITFAGAVIGYLLTFALTSYIWWVLSKYYDELYYSERETNDTDSKS